MGILGPWSSLHTNNFVWLIQDGARSHRKNWVGSKIPPKEDPRSQIPDGATIKISVFRLQLDVRFVFWFRLPSSIAFFKETLRAAMRNFIFRSSAVQRTLTCTCKAKSISTSGRLRFPLNICGGPVATAGPWSQVWDVDVAEGAIARS